MVGLYLALTVVNAQMQELGLLGKVRKIDPENPDEEFKKPTKRKSFFEV